MGAAVIPADWRPRKAPTQLGPYLRTFAEHGRQRHSNMGGAPSTETPRVQRHEWGARTRSFVSTPAGDRMPQSLQFWRLHWAQHSGHFQLMS